MDKFGVVVPSYKDRIIRQYSQAHNLVNGGDHAQALSLFDQASTEFCEWIEKAIDADPDNEKIIALWKSTNVTRRQLELPYIFPAGLGRAQVVDGICGYLSKGDLEALRYCAVNSEGKCVNIGVFDGLSTYFVGKNNPNLEVYGIDAYLGMNAQNTEVAHEHALKAKQNLSSLENAHLIVGLSSDIAQSWRDEIGFLFVDGDHSAEGAITDFTEWSPFVSADGLIAVHDAYRKVSQTIYKIRQRDNSHGPDIICQKMEHDPNYEFVKVSGCTEVWRKFGVVVPSYKDRIIRQYSQAHNLVMRNDYARALELLDRIAADVPELVLKTPQINYERAFCLKSLGRIREAEEVLRSCLSVRPDDHQSLGLLSEIQSIKERDININAGSKSVTKRIHGNKAKIADRSVESTQENFGAAIIDIGIETVSESSNSKELNASGTGFRPTVHLESVAPNGCGERRISQALELCNYGGALAREGEYVEALAFLEQVPIEYPDIAGNIADLQFSRAVCLKALGRFNEAETATREEMALDPQHSCCHKLLDNIRRERQDHYFICDTPASPPPAKSTLLCELCGIDSVYFERQFERDWYICPNCNLLRSNVSESEAKVLDNGSPSGSKSPTYSVAHRREEFFCRLFLKHLKLNDILLYGVGWSPVYKNIKEAGYNVVGCDLWRPLIEERNKEFGRGSFYHRDGLPDTKFDVISTFEVFEHFVRPIQEVQLLANHLKDNGIIVGCTDFWHGGSLMEHPNPDKSYWAHKSHVTAWTWKSMNAVAHQFGLKTYYCKTNKRNFAAKVFFIMYKGDKYEWFVRGLPKIFYDVW